MDDTMASPRYVKPAKFQAVSWREVEEGCVLIAENILREGVEIDTIIGILRGGWVPAQLLSDYLGVRSVGTLEIKFYKSVGETSEKPVVTQPLIVGIRDKNVLLVDDVSDTGKTLNVAVNFLSLYGPRKVYTATLYFKPWSMYKPDYYAYETDAWIIFPWDKAETIEELVAGRGMDLEEVSRITGDPVDFIRRIYATRRAHNT